MTIRVLRSRMAAILVLLLLFLACCAGLHAVSALTDPRDASALLALKEEWKNTPPNWKRSNDPCGARWDGVNCTNSRVTALSLSTMGLKGTLSSGDIGQLTELVSLDLSYNKGLTGILSPEIGNLQNLSILILTGCSFTGSIPKELGNLPELSFLALNSNNFTGSIPPSLGNLSQLYFLDLAENELTGPLPVSTSTTPGLDLLLKAKHFHFNKNKLSGTIPPKLFSSGMALIHILFDGNQLTGEIPSTVGLVQTLEVLRLDRNFLTGLVPSNLNNLTKIQELNLAHNQLSGPLPNLTGMDILHYLDVSNNSFDQSEAPSWFSTTQSLTTLIMEYGSLQGQVPQELFSFPQLQQVKLRDNAFNDILGMGKSISQQLQLVDLRNNHISTVTVNADYRNTLILTGNPVCTSTLSTTKYCQQQKQIEKPYMTNLAKCGPPKSCVPDQRPSPQTCECAYPYAGTLYFRAPSFRDLSNITIFHALEMSLMELALDEPVSVSLQNPFFNMDDYLQVPLELFPSTRKHFTLSEVQRIGFYLSSHKYHPPNEFGPYYFIASPYDFAGHEGPSLSISVIAGIATSCGILILLLIGVGSYAISTKRRAERANELSNPFASWGQRGEDSGSPPHLKGTRWITYDELKKCTNNFSDSNEIGSGGYGKVYRGTLSGGVLVAIKRAHHGSKQGGLEFKTEIELLSRVHHRNLVGLVGFCFERGEHILLYEFMPNGTIRESLSGRSGIRLDWKQRLHIALGSARGLAYLHDLADPPIIHRDVKSTNILLDEKLTAKVADFGLSKLISDSDGGHFSTEVKGTLGYVDPEYYMSHQLTEKSDVYSFGVVMLELVTSKKPIEQGKYIVREVRMAMDKNDKEYYGLKQIMDPNIRNMEDPVGFVRFVDLAMQCLEESAANRPAMSDIVKEIESILQNDGQNTNSTSTSSSSSSYNRIWNSKGNTSPSL